MMMGTERERGPAVVEALGLPPESYVVGMDFPGRLWNSHYLPEEVFAIRLAAELRILIGQGYRYLVMRQRPRRHQPHRSDRPAVQGTEQHDPGASSTWRLTLPQRLLADQTAGHADAIETSIVMGYDAESVDLGACRRQEVPLHSWEFSIVDGAGFTPQYPRDHVVRNDPRSSTRRGPAALRRGRRRAGRGRRGIDETQ